VLSGWVRERARLGETVEQRTCLWCSEQHRACGIAVHLSTETAQPPPGAPPTSLSPLGRTVHHRYQLSLNPSNCYMLRISSIAVWFLSLSAGLRKIKGEWLIYVHISAKEILSLEIKTTGHLWFQNFNILDRI
jgi:hypothetical protein